MRSHYNRPIGPRSGYFQSSNDLLAAQPKTTVRGPVGADPAGPTAVHTGGPIATLAPVVPRPIRRPAAKKGSPILSVAEAGDDYAVQGEYEGTVAGRKAGAQVIALPDGKARTRIYPGGLPGSGWDGMAPTELDGDLQGEKVVFRGDKGVTASATISANRLTGKVGSGDLALAKVLRRSSTERAVAPGRRRRREGLET